MVTFNQSVCQLDSDIWLWICPFNIDYLSSKMTVFKSKWFIGSIKSALVKLIAFSNHKGYLSSFHNFICKSHWTKFFLLYFPEKLTLKYETKWILFMKQWNKAHGNLFQSILWKHWKFKINEMWHRDVKSLEQCNFTGARLNSFAISEFLIKGFAFYPFCSQATWSNNWTTTKYFKFCIDNTD